jgi:hypothetical protein
MNNDKIDDLLAIGGSFDWITPLGDLIAGYNTIEHEGGPDDCKQVEKSLKAQGIKCRTDFTGDGWRVISKR